MEELLEINGKDWIDVRDRAIMELLYSSGLKLNELCHLDLADLDLED
jgi:integrase/recombinase XerC